jgi:hypothetical protein
MHAAYMKWDHAGARHASGARAVGGQEDPRKSDCRVVAKGCLLAKFATAAKPG